MLLSWLFIQLCHPYNKHMQLFVLVKLLDCQSLTPKTRNSLKKV